MPAIAPTAAPILPSPHPAVRPFQASIDGLTRASGLMAKPETAKPMEISSLLTSAHEHFLSGVTKFVTNGPTGATEQFRTSLWSDEFQLRTLSEKLTSLEERGLRFKAGDLSSQIDFPVSRAISDAQKAVELLAKK